MIKARVTVAWNSRIYLLVGKSPVLNVFLCAILKLNFQMLFNEAFLKGYHEELS